MTHCYCNTLVYHIPFYNLKSVKINISPLVQIVIKKIPSNTLIIVDGTT